ncbi:TonB-dependent receptor [Novosphingobium sp. KACC 22771]|uniref:TonB-dependent receptor n=1 Tax=Novosphingobium sp. KACC 22771 TaxID=3025670 RepID=UPI0023663598|nr:TonB-dependent receptor [Novosphingobium sp. KACC 22771]WDF75174.1 TonB-dependent receptor [Novosphingobium sp. KACC 22771]
MKSNLSSLLCLPLLAVASAPALAQQATDSGTAGEIVVTAQKRSESLHSVPVAVSVLTGATLAAAARPSIESASQLVPALNFQKSGTTLNQTIYLRGVGTATFSIAGEPSVSTVVDGVVYARSGEAFSDLVDIAQMEVLRGPQGTLFGKNASAGVINITSQMPKNEFSGSIEANYFEGNEWRVKGALNVPLGKDLAARFTGFASAYDGNIRNLATQSMVNGYDHVGGRAQFLYNPGTGVKIYVAADYHRNNDNCCADIIATGPLTGAGAPTTSLAFNVLPTPMGAKTGFINQNLVTSTKEEGWGVSGQADIDIGTHTLTSITAYREWNNTEIRDGDWLDRAYVGFNQLHDNGPQKSNTFSQELRLTSPAANRLSYVLGAYYSRAFSERIFTRNDEVCTATATAPSGVLIPCGSANANPSTFPSATADFGSTFSNVAVFGQATFKLAERVRLVGGLRYTHDKLDVFHIRRTTLAGPGINGNFDQGVFDTGVSNGVPFRTGTSKDNLSGKAVLQADLSRDVMAYASYARGYKGPAYNIFFNLTPTGTNVIAPETSDAFEVGLKNTLFGGKLTLNLAGFYAKYHNFQANNPDLVAGVVVTRFTNAGEVSTKGVEADMSWRLGPDTTLGGGLAYTDAHVVNFYAAPGAAATSIIQPGTPLAYAPKWKGSLSLDHRVRTDGWADLVFGASGNFQSSQLSLFTPNDVQRQFGTIPAYGLVNIQAGLVSPTDKWRIVAQVRNLFDQAYAASIINGGPGGSYRYQIPRDAMRYFGISARYNF